VSCISLFPFFIPLINPSLFHKLIRRESPLKMYRSSTCYSSPLRVLVHHFLSKHAALAVRPVAGGGAGGDSSPPPQNFWKLLKNITINVPKDISLKQMNVQQSVLNADAKSAFYNFTVFNRVRHLLSHLPPGKWASKIY